MVLNPTEFGKLSIEELTDFEKANNIQLPGDYKKFLLTYNGGQPIKSRNKIPESHVTYILGMHNGDYYASLYKHIDILSNRIPHGTFPIASDPFGNLFIMSIGSENYGQIFFWDHEGEPAIPNPHYIGNVRFVAYTFTEFIDQLE